MDKNENAIFITKSNALVEANYKLGLIEQKIILLVASKIQPTDSDFYTYEFKVKEFAEMVGLQGQSYYTELKKITYNLMRKVFQVRIENKIIQVNWLSFVAYEEGKLQIRFDPFLRPYLLNLKSKFTCYKLSNISKLKSVYSIRLYELLKQFESIRERIFDINTLKSILGIEGIYSAYGNFKQRVILPAKKELDRKTDITFEIIEIKKGKSIEKIKFVIISKYLKKTDKTSTFFQEDPFIKLVKQELEILGIAIEEAVINTWKKYGDVKVLSVLKYIKSKENIENHGAYITTLLRHNDLFADNKVVEFQTSNISPYKIIKRIYSKYKKSTEPIPDWLVEEEILKKLCSEAGLKDIDAKSFWDKNKDKIMNDINNYLSHNRR